MSDHDFTHAVLSVNVQLVHEHKQYKDTVEILTGITVVYGEFS